MSISLFYYSLYSCIKYRFGDNANVRMNILIDDKNKCYWQELKKLHVLKRSCFITRSTYNTCKEIPFSNCSYNT